MIRNLVILLTFVLFFFTASYALGEKQTMTPLRQVADGIFPQDVQCNKGLQLVFKATDGSPACVSIFTKDKLVQRGWAESEGFGAILEEPDNPSDDIQYVQGLSGTSLKLTGKGYIVSEFASTENYDSLTISAWVKPDYSQGSAEFTIISKENAFALSINNYIPPAKIAKFSVFDGVKWTMVESHSTIPEEWTHLAATFDGSSITIYVNGKLDSSVDVMGAFTLSESGQVTSEATNIKSGSVAAIGAYVDKQANPNRPVIKNYFSGLIDNVNLYDSVLDRSQIGEIYAQNKLPDAAVNDSTPNELPNTEGTNIPSPKHSWKFESP